MYIRGLIPRIFAELAGAVPIVCANNKGSGPTAHSLAWAFAGFKNNLIFLLHALAHKILRMSTNN